VGEAKHVPELVLERREQVLVVAVDDGRLDPVDLHAAEDGVDLFMFSAKR